MRYALFLDDERFPSIYGETVIARNFDDACYCVESLGVPYYISFDHDLGEGKDGYDFAKWMVDYILTNRLQLPPDFDFYVHSMNPVGAKNIREYMFSFMDKMGYIKL